MKKFLIFSLLTIVFLSKISLAAEAEDFREAAERGSAGAQSSLGWCYEHGDGVEIDVQEAVRWYKKAAEQGHPGGQCNLGSCYERGVGVEKDMKEAVRWYKEAAEQGHKGGLYNLGQCYEKGLGVKKNTKEAKRLYKEAAMMEHEPARKKLKDMTKESKRAGYKKSRKEKTP